MPRKSKRRYKKRTKSSLTKRVNALSRAVKGEWKINDTNNLTTYASAPALGGAYSAVRIAQGNGHFERIGDTIKLRSILIRGELQSATAGVVRMMLVIHKQPDGAALSVQSMFEQPAAGEMIYSPRSNANVKHYTVLMDRWYHTMARADLDYSAKPFKIFKKFKNPITVKYKGVGSSVSDVSANHVYFVVIGDALTPRVDFKYHMRSRFTEN